MMDKQTFIQQHKQLLVFIILSMFSFFSMEITGVKKNTVASMGMGIIALFQNGISSFFLYTQKTVNSINTLQKLQEKYNTVEAELQKAQIIEYELESVKAENKRLREILNFSQALPYDNIIARIIATEPATLFRTFIINKGKNSHIRVNMPVISISDNKPVLLGRVSEVSAYNAKVIPLTNNELYIPVRLRNTRYEGLLQWDSRKHVLKMHYIDVGDPDALHIGEEVVSSGLSNIYPEGLLIGVVEKIDKGSSQYNVVLQVRSYINFNTLEYVSIIQNTIMEVKS